MDEIKKLADRIEAEGQKAEAFFFRLEEDVWQRRLYADGEQWTVLEVLAHIVETEFSLRKLIGSIAGGGKGVSEDFDLDRYNAGALEELSKQTPDVLLAMFTARRVEMAAFVAGLSSQDLERRGRHPFLGDANLAEMLRLFYMHVNLHIRDIKKLMDKEGL